MKSSKDYERAYASAVRSLGLREHAQAELKSKLLRKGFDEDTACDVIEALLECEYLNDFSYAKAYIARARRKFKGDMLIKYELLEKGVEKELVEQAFADLMQADSEEVSEFERAMNLLAKTLDSVGINRNLPEKQERYRQKQRIKEKLSAKLKAKGFELPVVIKAVEKTVEKLEL